LFQRDLAAAFAICARRIGVMLAACTLPPLRSPRCPRLTAQGSLPSSSGVVHGHRFRRWQCPRFAELVGVMGRLLLGVCSPSSVAPPSVSHRWSALSVGLFALRVIHQGWQGLGMRSTRAKSAQKSETGTARDNARGNNAALGTFRIWACRYMPATMPTSL